METTFGFAAFIVFGLLSAVCPYEARAGFFGIPDSELSTRRYPTITRLAAIHPPDSTETYTLAIIRKEGGPGLPLNSRETFAAELLKSANNLATDEYISANQRDHKTRKSPVDLQDFEAMRTQGIQLGDRDSMVIIYKGNDPRQVVGSLHYAYPDKDGKLLLERDFDWAYPHPETQLRPYYELPGRGSPGWAPGIRRTKALTAGAIQLKTLVSKESDPYDWVPTLYFAGAADHLSDAPIGFVDTAKMPDAQRIELVLQADMGAWFGTKVPVMPQEYALDCDERRIPYYRRLGFKLVQPDPVHKGYYVMSASREDFVRMNIKLSGRPGYPMWNEYNSTPNFRLIDWERLNAGLQLAVPGFVEVRRSCFYKALIELKVVEP